MQWTFHVSRTKRRYPVGYRLFDAIPLLQTVNFAVLFLKVLRVDRRVELFAKTLEGGDPRAILKRGYSMVRDAETGKVIRSPKDTGPGRNIVIIPERGSIRARVEELSNEEI